MCFITDLTLPAAPSAVTINGVTWASHNVDAAGTFTAKVEDYGMLYQWDKRVGWPAVDAASGFASLPPTSVYMGHLWNSANDPCPAGWHLPVKENFDTLEHDGGLSPTGWIRINGILGMRFVDKLSGNAIFLPAVGSRSSAAARNPADFNGGSYWANTLNAVADAYYFITTSNGTTFGTQGYPPGHGRSVRCVK